VSVAEFNKLCRESVWKYQKDWEWLSERTGYWLDYQNPYITYSNNYIESVWWLLGQLHQKGLLVRGHKVLPYCPRCGTALSSHELALGYDTAKDPSVYGKGGPGAGGNGKADICWSGPRRPGRSRPILPLPSIPGSTTSRSTGRASESSSPNPVARRSCRLVTPFPCAPVHP
jgi:hypothetical protein